MTIAERLGNLHAQLVQEARAHGRSPDEIGLIAVSKGHDTDAIREAYAAGQRDFGESYPQELRDKGRALADLPDLRWHFIGRLQRNKAKYVAPVAHRVHALDALDQAEALVRRARGTLQVLVAVNLADEPQKSGVPAGRALTLCEELHELPGVRLTGLMCLPPWTDDPEDVSPYFAQLAELAGQGRARGLPIRELSMGMSHDWRQAVRHGATWVRIGTAIFGPRPVRTRG